jgi:tRNA G37 N-methylase TrmD
MGHAEIRIQGMDKLEQFAIEKEIPTEYVKVDTAPAGGTHGELLTTLVISAAAPALLREVTTMLPSPQGDATRREILVARTWETIGSTLTRNTASILET